MKHLILTGFMATGKTTVGRLVADQLGLEFVDTDAEIERRTGRSIAATFSADGEPTFREIEAKVVQELLSAAPTVMALGGGALLDETTRNLAESVGMIVALTCSTDEVVRRTAEDGSRPLLAGFGDDPPSRERLIGELMAARADLYARYPHIVTTERDPNEVAGEIVDLWMSHNDPLTTAESEELIVDASRTTRIIFGGFELGLDAQPSGRLQYVPTVQGTESNTDRAFRGEDSGSVDAAADGATVVLITDDTVDRIYRPRVRGCLQRSGCRIVDITIRAGERFKTLETVERAYRACYDARVDRDAVVVGLGGGVIGDVAGFVAATYLRGLRLVLMPTTLLAQVDAAIGGKVGVDFGVGKNMVGAFYPAETVVIDPSFLHTLPPGALSDGLAEMVKIAVMRDPQLLADLEALTDRRDILTRPDLVRRAALAKVDVVRRDPYESGERALLNFGHTTGHAVEALSGFSLTHGCAVAIGMVVATRMAVRLGLCDTGFLNRIIALLTTLQLPVSVPPDQSITEIVKTMGHDKKRSHGEIRFVLPVRPGEATIRAVPEDTVIAALRSSTSGHAETAQPGALVSS